MLELGPTTFIQILNFIILLVALRFILWKPLIEALGGRARHIESQVKEAEGINEEARDLKARYEEQMAQARSEAQRIIREAEAYAERVKGQLLKEAKEEAARVRKQAERDVAAEREKARMEVKRYLADLAVTTAAKVLEDSLDKPTHEKLMSEFVRKVGEKYVN